MSPSSHSLLGRVWVFWEEGPCSHHCGQHRLFRPPVARRCHRAGGGGNRTSPLMAVKRRPSPALALPWLLSTHPHQSAQFALDRALQSAICQRSLCLQLRAEGSSRKVPCLLHPSEQEETKVWGWMRYFRQVFLIMVIDSLCSLSAGWKEPSSPLPSLLSTLVEWQGCTHCPRGSIAKSEETRLLGDFIPDDN